MTTRTHVKLLREQDPKIRAVDIAKIVGVSKARVRAILVSEKMPTRPEIEQIFWDCVGCGKKIDRKVNFCSGWCKRDHYYRVLQCLNCNSSISIKYSVLKKKKAIGERTFCSYSCRHLWYWRTNSEKMRGRQTTP